MSRYVPLLTTLAWIAFIIGLLIVFRRPLTHLVSALEDRVRRGASIKLGSFEVGPLITETADLSGQPVEVYGDPDQLKLLFKAQTGEWKKSTKALQTPHGCLVQVTNERKGADGSWTVSEALEFVPGVVIVDEDNGRTLRAGP